MNNIQYFKTDERDCCATIGVNGTLAWSDPCSIIQDVTEWSEFCTLWNSSDKYKQKRYILKYKGVTLNMKETDGDGFFEGVAVDTGTLCYFDLKSAQKVFKFKLIPIK